MSAIHRERTYRDTWSVRDEHLHQAYDAYLKSPEWEKIRAKSKGHLRFTECYVCGRGGKLELHHRSYNTLGTTDLRNIVALCRTHHQEIHDYARDEGVSVAVATRHLKRLFGPTARQLAALEAGRQRRGGLSVKEYYQSRNG